MPMAIVPKNQFAKSETEIENEAMKWLVQQYFEELSEAETQEFFVWLDQSPEHRQVFESMEKMWAQLTEGDTLTMEAVDESANDLVETLHSVSFPEQNHSANDLSNSESLEYPHQNEDPLLDNLNVSHKPIVLAVLISALLIIVSIFIGQI
ncbi:hypothetical protein TDB9533_04147 [Thalassocella blandensis]|nr:hypothetical protein TDB9533_04147 [Thalassocella blandensis]